MIHTNRIVTVGEQESVIDRPIVLYRGDREVEIEFTLVGNEFMFSTEGNVIKSTNASHGQLVLNTPSGENMFSALAECHDGKVVFVVTKEMIDELIETGFYSFQVRLYDSEEMRSRVTIPPVMNGFDIRNPIAAEDETNVVDVGLVDYSRIVKDQSNEEVPTFDWNGNYNKTDWEHHDVITENKMNKIEDAIYSFNDKLLNSDMTYMKKIKDMETKHQNDVNKLNTKDKQLGDEIDEVNRTINNRIDKLEVDVNVGDVAWKNETEEFIESELVDVVHRANYINVDKYEYLVENNDWTLAVQTALNENNKIVITENINIYGTVTVSSGKVIEIGSCSITKPSDATNNGPIFWLRGNTNTLRGQGQGSSVISSKVSSPEGTVRIGHSSDSKADTNCLYNQICDLQINGASRDDGVSIGLLLRNAETDGLASYFHTISNLRITGAHMGLVLKGWSNANLINNIQLYMAGGNKTGGGICFLNIEGKVPMENSIYSVFHHGSQHARTIFIDCATFYNKFNNILSEQGGTEAICIYFSENANNAHSNYFNFSDNVSGGNHVSVDNTAKNVFVGRGSLTIPTIIAKHSITTDTITSNEIIKPMSTSKTYKSSSTISENENVVLLTVTPLGGANLQTALGTIKAVIRSSANVNGFLRVSEQKFQIQQQMNTIKIDKLNESGYTLTWDDGELSVKTPNNGTNTKNFTIWFELELFGSQILGVSIGEKFTQM